jgi:hypothetical protein
MMSHLCNRCVREFLILARTWLAFGLPSKTGCDNKSIWDVVEFGVQVPSVGDEDYDEDKVTQIQHFNSQATTILLTSLSREEYNKVQGLKSAKEIWDVLKTAHE